MTKPATRRYPFKPLEDRLRYTELNGEFCTTREMQAERLGIMRRQLHRLIITGVDEWQADRFAIAIGWLPWVIWPEFMDDKILELAWDDAHAEEADRVKAWCAMYDQAIRDNWQWHLSQSVKRRRKESLAAAKRRHYAANVEAGRAKSQKYRKENHEYVRKQATWAYQRDAESRKQYRRDYYKKNRDAELARQKAYDAKRRATTPAEAPESADIEPYGEVVENT